MVAHVARSLERKVLEIDIDLNVTFKLPKGRKAVVDAEELAEFVRKTWEAGELREDGLRYVQIDGVALPALIAFIKEKSNIDLSHGEALAIWKVANATVKGDNGELIDNSPWAQKKRSWDGPSETKPAVPGSTAAAGRDQLDPRYMPDPDDAPTA
jgi:hypothetical protein